MMVMILHFDEFPLEYISRSFVLYGDVSLIRGGGGRRNARQQLTHATRSVDDGFPAELRPLLLRDEILEPMVRA